MPPFKPYEQTVFEEAPRISDSPAMPVIKYEEDPTVLPHPINPALAVDTGVAWYDVGKDAFKAAGTMFEELLEYNTKKTDTDVNDILYDSEKKIFDLYASAQQGGVQTTAEGLSPFDIETRKIEDETKKKIADRLGAPSLFEESFTTDGWGSHWFPVIEAARSGMEKLSASSERVQRDAYLTANHNADVARKIDEYTKWGFPIDENLLRNVTTNFTLPTNKNYNRDDPDPTLTVDEQRQGANMMADIAIPQDGVGKVNSLVANRIRLLSDPTNLRDSLGLQALTLLNRMSPRQVADVASNKEELLMFNRIRLQDNTADPTGVLKFVRDNPSSPVTAGRILQGKDSKTRQMGTPDQEKMMDTVMGYIHGTVLETVTNQAAPDPNSLKRQLGSPWNPLGYLAVALWEKVFGGDVQAPPSHPWTVSGDGKPAVTAEVLLTDPFMQALTVGAMDILYAHPKLPVEETLKKYLDGSLFIPQVQRDKQGNFQFIPFVPQVGKITQDSMIVYNKGRAVPLTPEALSARAQMSLPLDETAARDMTPIYARSMDKAMNWSRTTVPMGFVQDMVSTIRNVGTNHLGAAITHGASQAQVLQYALITTDESLLFFHEKMGNKGMPKTEEDIKDTISYALAHTTTADMWGVQADIQGEGFVVNFRDIPIRAEDNSTSNLLTNKQIVPANYMWGDSLVLRSESGATPLMPLVHTLRDAQGNVDTVQEAKENDEYMKFLIGGAVKPATQTETAASFDITSPKLEDSVIFIRGADFLEHDVFVSGSTPEQTAQRSGSGEFVQVMKVVLRDVPELTVAFMNPDGTVPILNSKRTLHDVLNHPALKMTFAKYVVARYGVQEEQAKSLVSELLTGQFEDHGQSFSLESVLWDRNNHQSALHILEDLDGIVQHYYQPAHRVDENWISYPSANTMANMQMSDRQVSGQFVHHWSPRQHWENSHPTTSRGHITTASAAEYEYSTDKGPLSIQWENMMEATVDHTGNAPEGRIFDYFLETGKLPNPDQHGIQNTGINTADQYRYQLYEMADFNYWKKGAYIIRTDAPLGVSPGDLGTKAKADVELPTIEAVDRQRFPVVMNTTGDISTIVTMSFQETKDGPHILIPRMIGGKLYNEKAAIVHYQNTKEHFGIFSSKDKAIAFSRELSLAEGAMVATQEKKWFDLIGGSEGFVREAYNKDGVWTLGKGNTTHPDGRKVKQGDTISAKDADLYLRHFVYTKVLPAVSKAIPGWHQMNPNQQSAVISFAYNLGPNFYGAKDFETITKALSSPSRYKDVPAAMALYNKGRETPKGPKVVLQGLVTRRANEGTLFATPMTGVPETSQEPPKKETKKKKLTQTATQQAKEYTEVMYGTRPQHDAPYFQIWKSQYNIALQNILDKA